MPFLFTLFRNLSDLIYNATNDELRLFVSLCVCVSLSSLLLLAAQPSSWREENKPRPGAG